MHLLSRFGPLASTTALLFAAHGEAQAVPPPNLDIDALGDVTLAGNFDAISVYEFFGQQLGFSNNGTQSVLSQLPSGALAVLSSTDASITAMCPMVEGESLTGLVVGGNFTSMGGISARSVAILNPDTLEVTPVEGVEGVVSALYCDQETGTVYVGGAFEAQNSTNAIAWRAGNFASLPFAGFDAPVSAITKASNGHIVFGGSFTGLGNVSSNTLDNAENQVINLQSANISDVGGTTRTDFGDPRSIVCPANGTEGASSTFLLADNTPGSWRADFAFGFEPTKLRLWNTNAEGRGTRTWRFTAHPINGIMNFTYVNPETGADEYCDSRCPLAQNTDGGFQDFFFVNLVGMNSFTIDISDWYGDGGGLDGVEIFQSDIFAYAIEAFDEPTCETAVSRSDATATGPWYYTPSRESVSDYLTVVTGPTTVDTTSIVFQPDVQTSGNYSIIIYTPGCLQDSSCSARAIVNVSATLTQDGGEAFSTQLFQTNDFDKYDAVYQGRVDATADGFRPSITITPSGLRTDQLVVASRVKLGFISSTGGLNGLFEYNPADENFANIDLSASAINAAGNRLDTNAQVLALTTHDDTIYIAGQFSDSVLENIMAFSGDNVTSLPDGGLNATVTSIYGDGDFLYVGGNFTGTNGGQIQGLSNAAAYSYAQDAWIALGAGLNGPVDAVCPMRVNLSTGDESAIVFSGSFTEILAAGSHPSVRTDGLAIWIPSQNTWLETLDIPKQALAGQLMATSLLPNGTWIGAGTLHSSGVSISGAVGLDGASSGQVSLQRLPIDITPNPTQSDSGLRKRALIGDQNITGVTTGAYYTENGANLTIFAGHFSATASDGSQIDNLMFLNGSNNNLVTGAPAGIDANSTILAMGVAGELLFYGGLITGQVNEVSIQGLVVYDLTTTGFRSPQPAPLTGPAVIVNAISPQPGTSAVYVGGSFESTSQGLSCPSVCMYDTGTSQWNTVGSGLEGTVTDLYWTASSSLMATGNLSVLGNETYLAMYNIDQQEWTVIDNSMIPGPVTAFAPATDSADRMWVAGTAANGSTYLMEIDTDGNRPVLDAFSEGTTIQGLQILPLTENHGDTEFLNSDRALLVTGQLNITDFGSAAAALFNGTTMQPLILASTSDGSPGSISQLFSSRQPALSSSNGGRSRGIVVLVALCAALGTIFLIILLGIILNRIQRRRAGYKTVPSVPYADKNSNIHRVPPESLLAGLERGGKPTV